MLKYLVSFGMVTIDDDNIIFLTEKGAETALRYQQYYTKLENMMQKCFPDLDESENAVLALLSEIPEQALQRMLQQK
jgi:Mn-dependent DtxR family transcriptional regulator